MENRKRTHWSTRMIAAVLALIMMLGNVPASVFAEELTGEEAIETTVPETSVPVLDETEQEATETVPETTAPAEETTEPEVPETTAPPETENTDELIEMTSDEESPYEALYREISVKPGQLMPDPVEVVENEIYGYVVNYKLKKGHTLSISDTNYVFSVRVLKDGNYSTMLKQATTASYTAAEDMTIGMLIRKPDKSALTAEELANVVIYDTLFDMKNVDGNVHRFTVKAETIGGGTHTTRAAIFLPDRYSESGTPTRLIVMTNGYHGHLNDTHWNANKPDDVAVMKHYMDADYAVLVVDNTAEQTSYTADAGCPQQVSGYFKAYEYVQKYFNVDELFALHARSQGNLVALRIMREHPELVKCALMTGSQLSFKQVWDMVDKAFVANRFGFDDATGATYEAEKVIGYDPLVDADGVEYDLPPTFWMMAQSDASSITLSGIEKIKAHGNDVTTKVYTGTDHSGVCRLNIDECWNDALAYLNAHQTSNAEHRYKAWTVTKEATCTENGEMRRSCADCAHYETMTLETVGVHSRAVGTDFCSLCGKIWLNTLCNEIPAQINKLQINGTVLEDAVYGHIRDYMLPQGHTLSISSADHVFSVRQLLNGDYSTTLKVPATADGYTAASDIIVGAWIRRPDSSELAEGELAGIHMIDSIYGMINVDGYVHRFTVKAETIGGGTHTTRAAIFLPDSYSESGTPTRLIVMTNGYSAYLTDSVWNGNTADNVGIIRNYLNAGYAVYVVDNTTGRTTQTPDIGCPQLVSSYRKAYEYIQKHFNVEEKFSIHSRSFGTFAAMRLMQEVPELIKCAVMTGPRVSLKLAWSAVDKKFVANRFGFADTTGTTYEADKMVGHDPYTDVDGDSYALPPTYWAMSKGDATAEPMEVIEKLIAHGNDVTSATYTGTDHTGVCTLNTEEMFSDALAFLESHQTAASSEPMSMRYDDHLDVSGKVVEIIDAGKPTSYQVGYSVAEGTLDTAVVTLEGNTLVATGIGTAKVRIDGTLYEVTVTAAPISLLLLIGQSNMRGSEGSANQSIVCPDGMVYATYGDDRGEDNTAMTVSNATRFAPSALTGAYSSINVEGTTDCLSGYPVCSLTDAGTGKIGPDSGFAYEWVKQTGEKVWIVNAAHGGTNITAWQPGTTEYEECQALFTACQETLRKEIAAGHFTLSHMGYFWCQGCTNRTNTAEWYVQKYLTMHEGLKTELAFDHDSNPTTANKTFEFGGIIPVRVGSTATCYRDGVYETTNPYAYHESYVDLRFSGPRVAQYWMCNNPELEDIWMVCNIGEDWVWMPDGTNGVSEYFRSHYENGTVDYTTQVAQKASWYTPTTPAAVHDSIHYNQIGYNELGRESVRNALIMLGEIEAPEVETTVELLSWDGYSEVTEITASTSGNSATLVVPKVYPLWKSKEVTYELSDGLTWNYYDLLAADAQTDGTLTSGGKTVHVIKTEPGSHFVDHLTELPENVCCELNLWNVLEHDEYYYANGIEWDIYSSGNVPSITILVNPGDKIYASSFGKAGTNGHSSTNGIRMTFFSEYGVVKTMAPADTYAEFSANGGYLIAPEGAVAINIPMWGDSAEWEIYILNRAHDMGSAICSICGKDSHDHEWSEWETVSLPTADALGIEQRKCECGETETREVEGVWQKYALADHLQQLPDPIYRETNIWAELKPEREFLYEGTYWGTHSSAKVCSVTFPLNPGDQLYSNSFRAHPENGNDTSTSSGIRVTFFDVYGVAKTMAPAETYAEFAANGGYLVAPEGAIAVNVVQWVDNENSEVRILNLPSAPKSEIADYKGKVISILGDSISTFAGYIPVADGFNLEHLARYPQDNLLTDVNETWWMQIIHELDAKLGINDSWASTEVYNYIDAEVNSTSDGTKACMASLTRIQNLGSNGTPDLILFFGGTNDITQTRPLGTFDSNTAPTEVDLTSVKWGTVADAYVDAIMRMQHYYPDAKIVAMLPYYRTSQGDGTKVDRYNDLFVAICEHYGVPYVDLRHCGITSGEIPDGTHPDADGMDDITAAVLDVLMTDCDMAAGEHMVHSVTHNLTNAESSLSYYKGVSHGKSFVTTVSGENLTVTVTMGGRDVTEAVYQNGVVNIPNVTGDLLITATGRKKTVYEDYLQELPENICAGTNLWTVLEPINLYYRSAGWGLNSTGLAHSVTFCISAGDKIWATSFQESGINGGTKNGIALTWFDAEGVIEVLSPEKTYAEFAENGYLTAPKDAVAVNVVMWNGNDTNEVYILNRAHDYSGTSCIICGSEHPEVADYAGKVISILGDSISTFAGYIPVADGFNLEHLARYPQDNLLTDVNETWWMQIINELDAKLGINDSWRGATVSGAHAVTTGSTGENAAMHNLTRIQNLGSNGTPDVILFYGGTNDLAHVSKVGTFNAATAPAEVDLTTKKWDNLADGYVHTLLRLKHFYPDAVIVAMLPTVTTSYYSDAKLAQANEVLAEICEHYGVAYVDLRYCGITTKDLPDGIHPDATGMDYITAAVLGTLIADCEMTAGEHVVYQVNHNLTGVTASAGYIKGISAGKGFEETLTADNTLTVTVTMGGMDITESCYADGKVSIEAVTGDILITAAAKFSLGDRLQQLPDPYYGVNLWPVLRHDTDYYTVTGWAEHSSGKVRSVTIPVAAGEKLYASSFAAASENGSSTNGIRITFFSEDGVLISMSAPDVYAEFTQNGYITVPENAVAVNIPMWTASTDWELYVWESSYEPTFSLGDRLQQLPAEFCAGTNLWDALEPQNEYYTGSAWGNLATNQVWSVTIPVSSGDQIYATSFEKYGSNGNTFNTTNGIRVTYFGENGILKSVTPGEVYTEFVKAGFLTVPEGANAVNIPMWSNSGDNELYILNREHDYKGTTCTICGAEHPETADYSGKVISILGASICTFEGYIPKADGFNLEHIARYPQDNLLTDVNETWWMQVIAELDAKLGINDSWRSTEVYNACTDEVNSSYDGTKACLSSVTRIQNLGSNGTPDVILFFGGTNDITQRRPLGAFDPDTAPTKVDLTTEIWESVVDAYTALIMRLQHYYPDAEIIVMLPYGTNSNSDAVTKQYTSVFSAICEHYGVRYVDLMECGIAVSDLPDGTHPNAEGMDYITDAVLNTLLSECDITAGENTVHSVTHELTGVNSSLGYYKGVSHGKSFVTTITGEDLTVTVTMGGVDITDSVYANGVVNIPSVTGDLVITAKGKFNADGRLQQLPENICAGTNLWPLLEPVNEYYTVNGWGNNSNSNYSVTIPATAGDRIWATSFGAAGENGYSENAVRITWFSETGVLESLSRDKVYAEFAANGYVTAPEGAVALNVPMASDADTWELYILNLPHSYESVVIDPTCTEQGYTTHTCTVCGDNFVDSYLDATGHSWGEWQVEREAQMEVAGLKVRVCGTCGEREETEIPALQEAYPDILHGHLQAIPDGVYAHTNLWPLLEPENEYFYAGTHWGTLDNVVSVTIPISPGDQIYASSFKRGIRVAFFGTDGLLISLSSTEVKAEFEENGYITVPNGAVAVNIPMWDNSADNMLRILTLERIECQEHVFTRQETIAQPGLVSKGTAIRYCDNCGYAEKVETPELMLPGEYAYQNDETSIMLPYRTYYPSSYENGTQTQYPIVIFYHGAGSRGTNNESQVLGKAIINRLVELDNCVIIAPQCDVGYQWVNTPWGNGSYDSASVKKSIYLDASIALLDEIVLNKRIDKERVYAIGLSMGGYATWNVMMEYPEKFAAVVPICGAADPSRANEVLGVAVWAFHGDEDSTVPVSGSREMIEAIRALGGIDVRYTEYAGVGHDSWVKAFAEPELTQWLFSQKKHVHSYETTVTAPTCTEQGFTTHTCSKCNDTYKDSYVEASGHAFGEWTQVTAPACDAEGKDKRICGVCSHEQHRDTRISGDSGKIQVSNPVAEDYFAGKHLLLVGDSITYGVGVTDRASEVYGILVGQKLGMIVTNKGVSGSGYCTGGKMATNKTLTEDNVRNADVITIMLGTNDFNWAVKDGFWNGKPGYYDKSYTYYQLGEFGSDDTSTFYGALKFWCEEIVRLKSLGGFEDKQFVVITPTIVSWNASMGGTRDWNQDKVNVHGHTLRQYCTAILEVCAAYEIPVFDANMFSGIYYNSSTDNNVAATGGDGVHINAQGHALLAKALEEFLLEGYTYEERMVANCGHGYEATVTEPGCTESGFTTYRCPECHYSYVDNEVPAKGHSFGDWEVTTEPTCTKMGEERRDCENCDHYEIREVNAIGHDYEATVTAPTCEDKGFTTHTCSKCGDSYVDNYVDATGHEFGEWTVTTAPTCTEKGEERRDCENCDHFEIREVNATGHGYKAVVTKPTCEDKGFTTHTCSKCGDSYVDNYVDATGHEFGEWTVTTAPTCTEKGEERRDCENCDHFEIREVNAIGHDYEAVVTDPTCTEQGFTTHTCACGDTFADNYVDATGHKFGEWTVTSEPTCTETGEERRDCGNCDHFETREVDATGHDYEAVVTEPTCEDKGYTTHTCSVCGDSYVDSYVDATRHDFESGTCVNCGEPEVKYLRGDMDLDGDVDVDDVLALLWYVLFPDDYPIKVDADFDRNGATDVDDVLALLWYVLFPEDYPLN